MKAAEMKAADSSVTHAAGMPRVYFALWPPSKIRSVLSSLAGQLQGDCGGRTMHINSLHCTLLFLGQIQQQRLKDLLLAADRLHGAPFCLPLDRLGCWQHNKIGFIAPSVSPPTLEQLVADLRQHVSAAGFRSDGKSFFPHVTLLRDIVAPVERHTASPLEWEVKEFVLVESLPAEAGPRYRILKSWPLC